MGTHGHREDGSPGTFQIRTESQRGSQRVHWALYEFARRHSESVWARRITAEDSPGTFQIRTSQRGRFDTHDPRRGFIGHFTNLHGATTRALGRTGSLQRVHRAVFKFRTASQRGRCGTHNPRRGFIGRFTNSHGATVGALRGARSLQRVHRAQHEHVEHGER